MIPNLNLKATVRVRVTVLAGLMRGRRAQRSATFRVIGTRDGDSPGVLER